MANPVSSQMKVGLIGELLVELRLLQYGIQSSKPRLDSGNDLVASSRKKFYALQIKSTTGKRFSYPNDRTVFDILIFVKLNAWSGEEIELDKSELYLIRKEKIGEFKRSRAKDNFLLSPSLIKELFNLDAVQKDER